MWERNIPFAKESLLDFFHKDNYTKYYEVSKEIDCSPAFGNLKKYIANGSIAIISMDDKRLLNYYACEKTHNTFLINPYYESFINPKAQERILRNLDAFSNPYLLIDSTLLNAKTGLSVVPLRVLKKLHAKKIATITLGATQYVVFNTSLYARAKIT